mmetsp:Transcript_17734/g.29809  ORF Transcript_17734/g.29809 Transcript_17734/m.29809 type:complete len:223 (-) Transcript_17734:438-1106(-)
MSSSRWGLVTIPLCALMRVFSARFTSRSSFSRFRPSRLPCNSESSPSSSSRSTSFSFCTNCNFSFRCVSTCTVVVVFLRSLRSSSLRSSIFSFSDWFSILSCSKSMRCSPSASSSLAFKCASSFFIWLRSVMFLRRTRSTSCSFFSSWLMRSWMMRSGMGFPVRLFSEDRATSSLNVWNALRMSLARVIRSSRRACMSKFCDSKWFWMRSLSSSCSDHCCNA